MWSILGYARVSTSNPDVSGQKLRLEAAHFERRLIVERMRDDIAAARAKGKRPGRRPLERDKAAAALKLVEAGLSPTAAVRQVGLGRATMYREMAHAGIGRRA